MTLERIRLAWRAACTATLVLTAMAGLARAQQPNPFTSPADVEAGRKLFQAHCSRCHGQNARGGETGPNLTTGQFKNASSDAGLFKVISEGVPNTEMIGIYRGRTDQTVWQIIAYLRSISRRPENIKLAGNPGRGQQVFAGKGNCTGCHRVAGEGGRLGPDLSTIGDRRSPEELKADLVDPNARVEPRWWTMRVTRADDSIIEGLRMDEDTFSMRLMDAKENLWSFQKRDLRSHERIESSSMPNAASTLTTNEIDDLVAYLFSLRKKES